MVVCVLQWLQIKIKILIYSVINVTSLEVHVKVKMPNSQQTLDGRTCTSLNMRKRNDVRRRFGKDARAGRSKSDEKKMSRLNPFAKLPGLNTASVLVSLFRQGYRKATLPGF